MRYLLFIVICIPMLYMFVSEKETIDEIENRTLQTLPTKPTSMKGIRPFFNDLKEYFNDHFIKRKSLISFFSNSKKKLGITTLDKHIIGDEDWIFNNWDNLLAQHKGLSRLSAEHFAQNFGTIKQNKNYFAKRNTPFYCFIAPDKLAIYEEYFPKHIKLNGNANYDKFYEKMAEEGISFFELKEYLRAVKKEEPNLLYFKQDSHWSKTGAFYAYKEMMKTIKKDFPAINVLTKDQLKVKFRGSPRTLATGDKSKLEKIMMGELYPVAAKLEERNILKKSKQSRERITYFRLANQGPKILFIHDSFGRDLLPYFQHCFFRNHVCTPQFWGLEY